MRAVNQLKSHAGQAWHTLLDTLSRSPNEQLVRSDLACFALILASFAAGLAASWQRWGNPLVDSGREMNVPLRLVHGEMLYSDVGYIYGPFSPYLNAFLYRLFHPSLWVLWGHGIVSTMLILALSYWIARQIAGRFPSTIACLAITWVCALKSQGNYMMAYSFGGLDGLTFLLANTVLLVIFLRKKNPGVLLVAGLFGALAILAKTELGGAAVGTGVVAATLAGYPGIRKILASVTLFLAPSFGIPALVFSWFARRVGWRTLTVDSHLFFGHVPWQLMYFNGLRFGFAHPWHSLGLMLASMIRLIAFGGLLASISLLIEMRWASFPREYGGTARDPSRAVTILLISLAGIGLSGLALSDLGPFISMPFLLLVLAAGGIAAFVRGQRIGATTEQLRAGTTIIIVASALSTLARIVLRVSSGGALSSFLLPGSVILFVYLWLVIFPAFLPDHGTRLLATQLVSVILSASVLATAITVSVRYRQKFPYPLVTARGTWRTPADLGVAFTQALKFIEKRSAAGDAVAILPEGTSLLFLSERRNPLREEIVTPGFLDDAGEERAIASLRRSQPPLVFIANRPTSEFAEASFGKDYNQRLMSWIERNYALCGVFGPRRDAALQIGAPVFFLRVYCLASATSKDDDLHKVFVQSR